MVDLPYMDYHTRDMNLRDFLALHRTKLANERTFLAYLRTSLALSGAGITFIKFFEFFAIIIVGWFLVPLGIIVLIVGIKQFFTTREQFEKLDIENEDTELVITEEID